MKTKKYTFLAFVAFFSLIFTSCDALMPKARRSKPSDDSIEESQLSTSKSASSEKDESSSYVNRTSRPTSSSSMHQHLFSDAWSYDENTHWKESICEHAGLKDQQSAHEFVEIERVEATYDSDGYVLRACSVCGYQVRVTLNQLEHNYSSSWSKDEQGHWHACIDPGYEDLRKDYSEHTFYLSSSTPASYSSPSQEVYKCSICNQQKTILGDDQLEHNYSNDWSYDRNNHWHACIDEGYSQLTQDLSAHDLVFKEHIDPTFETNGKDVYECSVCKYTVNKNIVPKLTHNYSNDWSYDENYHWHGCVDSDYEDLYQDRDWHSFEYQHNNYHLTIAYCTVCNTEITTDYDGYYYFGAPEIDENGLMYFLNSDGEYAVFGGKDFTSNSLVIPAQFNGKPVTRVMAEAFHNYDFITSLVLPNTLKEIGSSAFSGCRGLTSVEIPGSVKRIKKYGLGFNSFTSITLQSGVEYLEDNAFNNCNYLRSITIPDTVTYLSSRTFENCNIDWYEVDPNNQYYSSDNGVLYNKDKSELILCPVSVSGVFVIPDNLSSVDEKAFVECLNITAFEVGSNNQYFSSVDGVLYNKNQTRLIRCPASKSGDVVTPATVVEYAANSFANCQSITSIELAYGLTEIWENAFAGCSSLTSVIIPNTVTRINGNVFYECSNLTTIDLPNSLEELGQNAFYGSGIIDVFLPANVRIIDQLAFQDASQVASVTVDENNPYFSSSDGILYNKDMTRIIHCPAQRTGDFVVLEGVKEMNDHTFWSARKITSISFPASFIDEIKGESFANCASLLNIYVDSSNTSYCSIDGVVYSKDCTAICVAPRARTGTFVVPEGVTRICRSAFYCSHFNLVILPRSLTVIENDGFYVCDELTELVILSCDVDFNNDYSIRACYYLENVYLTTTWGDSTYINKVREGIQYDVNIYFYSEEEPSTPNMFWHYVDGVPTVWP